MLSKWGICQSMTLIFSTRGFRPLCWIPEAWTLCLCVWREVDIAMVHDMLSVHTAVGATGGSNQATAHCIALNGMCTCMCVCLSVCVGLCVYIQCVCTVPCTCGGKQRIWLCRTASWILCVCVCVIKGKVCSSYVRGGSIVGCWAAVSWGWNGPSNPHAHAFNVTMVKIAFSACRRQMDQIFRSKPGALLSTLN